MADFLSELLSSSPNLNCQRFQSSYCKRNDHISCSVIAAITLTISVLAVSPRNPGRGQLSNSHVGSYHICLFLLQHKAFPETRSRPSDEFLRPIPVPCWSTHCSDRHSASHCNTSSFCHRISHEKGLAVVSIGKVKQGSLRASVETV